MIDQWLSTMALSTARVYERAIRKFETFAGGDLHEAQRVDARAWAEQLSDSYAPATVRTYLSAASSLYTFMAWENPFEGISRPSAEGELVKLNVFQVRRVVGGMDRSSARGARDYAMISAALYAGLRSSEIAGLTWEELRELPVPTAAAIVNYRRVYERRGQLLAGVKVFVSLRYKTRGLSPASVRRALSAYGVTVEILRRTGEAGMADGDGADLVELSRALGRGGGVGGATRRSSQQRRRAKTSGIGRIQRSWARGGGNRGGCG